MPVAKLIPRIVKPILSLFYFMAVIILFYIIIIKINFDYFFLCYSVHISNSFLSIQNLFCVFSISYQIILSFVYQFQGEKNGYLVGTTDVYHIVTPFIHNINMKQKPIMSNEPIKFDCELSNNLLVEEHKHNFVKKCMKLFFNLLNESILNINQTSESVNI